MITQITEINADWKEVKNECRNTVGKAPSEVEATKDFIKKVLISEHSPIRLVNVKWRWEGIKSWVATHFSRHWLGFDKWISTQRTDRTGVDRDNSPQSTPVNMDVKANAQALINVGRYRLCYQSSPETRQSMEKVKYKIKAKGQKELSDVIVPNCVYRFGCPEFDPCPFFKKFLKYCDENQLDISSIQLRYDAYNQMFTEKIAKLNATR